MMILDGVADPGENGDGDDTTVLDLEAFCKKLESYGDACSAIDRARKILDSINFELEADDSRIKRKLLHLGNTNQFYFRQKWSYSARSRSESNGRKIATIHYEHRSTV